MIEYPCPECGNPWGANDPERVGAPCASCRAARIWATLPAQTRREIDDTMGGSSIPAVRTIREALPSLAFREAVELYEYRRSVRPDPEV